MKKGKYLDLLLRSPKTIFTAGDIAMLWSEAHSPAFRVRLKYYVNRGDLIRLRRGIYAKDEKYDRLELATRIFTPAYISFETVLKREGLIFQYYESVFVASYLTRDIQVAGQEYHYRKIKDEVLVNAAGITRVNEAAVAGVERAFLDTLYLNSDYHFDNLRPLDWEKVMVLLPIYKNKRLAQKVSGLFDQDKERLNGA